MLDFYSSTIENIYIKLPFFLTLTLIFDVTFPLSLLFSFLSSFWHVHLFISCLLSILFFPYFNIVIISFARMFLLPISCHDFFLVLPVPAVSLPFPLSFVLKDLSLC